MSVLWQRRGWVLRKGGEQACYSCASQVMKPIRPLGSSSLVSAGSIISPTSLKITKSVLFLSDNKSLDVLNANYNKHLYINSTNPHNNPIKQVPLLLPLYRSGSQGTKRFSNLLTSHCEHVTELGLRARAVRPQTLPLSRHSAASYSGNEAQKQPHLLGLQNTSYMKACCARSWMWLGQMSIGSRKEEEPGKVLLSVASRSNTLKDRELGKGVTCIPLGKGSSQKALILR